MDEFGVLVKSYGIKPQGKSSPMASSKTTPKPTHNYNRNKSVNLDPSSFGPNSYSNSSTGPSFNDDLVGFNNSQSQAHVFDDVFTIPSKTTSFSGGGGGGFDIESMFKGSMSLKSKGSEPNDDDLIWGFSGKTTSSSGNVVGLGSSDDLLSSDPVDDFFGKFGSNPSGFNVVNIEDDLLPGFGVSNAQYHRAQAGSRENSGSSLDELEDFVTGGMKRTAGRHLSGFSATKEAKKTSSSSLEELEDFVTGGAKKSAKGHLNGFSATKEVKKTGASLDDFDNFVTGGAKKTDKGHSSGFSAKKEAKKAVNEKSQETNFFDIEGSFNGDSVHKDKVENVSDLLFPEDATDLDTFFGAHTKKSVPVTEETTMNMQADGVPDLFSETTYRMEKNVPSSGFPDDFSSIFGGASTSAVFEEIEGESEERRRARLGRYQRASARMAQALAEMNEREYQAQQEQEEKHRIADAMDFEMKQWAAGKEGNLRALLSSLQQVLAPEFGWRPVTLTDLITSSQVKIAYKKAALCVHPDKVQQKGASLQQKFVAEKVFDLLKEAWNKFNAEELR